MGAGEEEEGRRRNLRLRRKEDSSRKLEGRWLEGELEVEGCVAMGAMGVGDEVEETIV